MLVHVFLFRWSPSASDADKARAIVEISAFEGAVPGLLEVHIGQNISPRGAGYETAGVMKFTDAQALSDYATHPLHTALLEWLLPLIDPIEVDFHTT